MHLLAGSTAIVLAALSLVHIYWAVAGGAGAGVLPGVNGAPAFRPGAAATVAVATALATAGMLLWEAGGAGPALVPMRIARVGAWLVAAAFLARAVGDFRFVGFFKRVRGTRFAALDTRVYSPLCLVLGLASAAVAQGGG